MELKVIGKLIELNLTTPTTLTRKIKMETEQIEKPVETSEEEKTEEKPVETEETKPETEEEKE